MTIDPTQSRASAPLVIPAGLNVETAEQREVYRSALEFERFFVQQMLKPMQGAGSLLSGDDDSSGTSGMSGYNDMAQDQLTQAVLDGGGLGIAATLYTQMAEAAGVATTSPAKPGGDAA